MTEFIERGHIDKVVSITKTDTLPKHLSCQPLQEVLDTSNVTKEIAEIFAPLEKSDDPQFILIEGAPGIGKSLLLKHIAYQWGKHQILQKFKLVLLICLRNPAVQQMSFIDDLLQSFCKRDKEATEVASVCRKYFGNNNGKDLALLFDGYDEYPERLRKESLIADILKRKELPCCGLIVSSRPHASVSLRKEATVKVDILGFTEAERELYIKESMKGQPQKIDEFTQYLQGHSTINSLCFVPFNLVILIYLYKQGFSFPKNSAELYSYFIYLTIYRHHLAEHGHCLQGNITKLNDLPEPYNKMIQQLSKLSLEALDEDKLIFTFEEIKAYCPNMAAIPGGINGFGLLQAVEHFGFTGTITTINFLHFSIQEYLAAHHIANLPADEELKIIEEKFWSDNHFNMFSIYVSLTKGQGNSFKRFLRGGTYKTISDKFLKNQLQCLRLYHCFHEAGDVDICKTIERSATFSDKEINLSRTILMASDVECVTVFLTSSFHKEWVWLYLSSCYIQDHGLHILHRGLLYCTKTIVHLLLSNNGLTTESSSLISDITMTCKVKVLWIDGNHVHSIRENEQLYSMLSNPSTMLEELHMEDTKLSSRAATALFTALKDNNKLKELHIDYNDITDDACATITTALERNSCLARLIMYNNPLTGEAIVNIVNGLKVNNTLELLWLPSCPYDIMEIICSLQAVINKNRESRVCQVKLMIYCN